MNKNSVIRHLEGRKEQLKALILLLENRGEKHPQYNNLEMCKTEYETVINQLKQLNDK